MDRRHLLSFDWGLLLAALFLLCAGLLCIHSATYQPGGGLSAVTVRQLQWCGVAGAVLFVILLVDYDRFVRWGYVLYGVGLLLLLAVAVSGTIIKGARSWLVFGPARLQPSEFVKIALALCLVRHISARKGRELRTRQLVIPGLLFAVPFVLVLEQPDLGTALIFVPILAAVLFVAGLHPRTLAIWSLVGLLALPVASYFFLKPYQLKRITTLWNPEEHLQGSGWQVVQSKIAVGSGQLLGRGYLQGKQSQLGFIPEQHTDFVFSVLAEEWGFVGSALAVLAYLLLFSRGLRIAAQSRDREGAYLAAALVAFLFFQACYNVAMVLGVVPITGIPLPFVSYGGSALLTSTVALGLLLNIGMRRYS